MPRVALYIRVSTDEQALSAETQERGAVVFCQKAGHAVVATYRDIGHSGAEWVHRPGVLDLERDARKSPRPFDLVIVRDVDRLGRDAVRLPMLLATLREHGVGVVEYSSGRAVELDGVGLIVSNVLAAVAQVERETIARRVRTAHATQVAAGRVVGGAVYGYRNVRTAEGVHHAIDDAQAAVVREIFERHAKGEGVRTIAHDLNARSVPSPHAGRRGTGSWAPSAVYDIVHRDRYRGLVTWGAVGSTYRGGTRIPTKSSDLIEVRDPKLAIVSEALWRRAQRTRDAVRVASDKPPHRGREARYLLVGLAVCDGCGGPIASTRTRRAGVTVPAYACAWHRERGDIVCTASWKRPVEEVDRVVLSWLTNDVLNAKRVRAGVAAARRRLVDAPAPIDATPKLRAEERELAGAVARLAQAIETADDVPEIVARLRERKARLAVVRAELALLAAPAPVIPVDVDAQIEETVDALHAILATDLRGARQVLEGVLRKRMRMSWELVSDGRGRARRSEVWVEAESCFGNRYFNGLTGGKAASPEEQHDTPRCVDDKMRRAV